MEERIALFRDYDAGVFTVSGLCELYGVSRETFYVWKRRRDSGEPRWWEERSHATSSCPHRTPEPIAAAVIGVRQEFKHFGPKKIRAVLAAREPGIAWPAVSTMGGILKQAGLIQDRPRRRRPLPQSDSAAPPATAPNEEWAIDFKGWFRTRDGVRCDPLTITDAASRYLIEARHTRQAFDGVQPVLERVFKEAGLPGAIRSDNGAPFGSSGAGGLSRLSVWWLKLGIEPRYIRPASPQDNGRHERMHRTLKAETSKAPAETVAEQQQRFDAFRRHYNGERPHEALDQTPPAQHWRPSPRQLPAKLEDPWYDADHEVRRVHNAGEIKWRGEHIFIGEALAGEIVGLASHESGGHLVRFCGRDLGLINRNCRFLRFAPPRTRLRCAQEPAVTAED